LVARDDVSLSAVATRTGAAYEAFDLTNVAALPALVRRIEEANGPVDVLVNNAGAVDRGLLTDSPPEAVASTMALNFAAPIMLTRLLLPGMISRGRGAVVMMSSVGAILACPGLSVYCASKAGLSRFVHALELELGSGPVAFTLVEACALTGGRSWDDCIGPDACIETRRFSQIAHRLGLAPETSCTSAAESIVDAVRLGRRRVRIPARHRPLYGIANFPNTLSSYLYKKLTRQ
jgi:short-subunit dehydrogenase